MVKNSAPLLTEMVQIFQDEVATIKNVTTVQPSVSFQPITTDMMQYFTKNGGNCLGLSVADGPLNLINVVVSWVDASDDAAVLAAAGTMISRMNSTAISMGLGNPFVYQNYASQTQDVFDSYGAANKQKLVQIHQKYDPTGVFTKLQPGYFKI